jgi:methylated-DNA-[protein]-cysteine S-methyltransferase
MYARDMALIATPVGCLRIEGDNHHIDRIRIEPETTATIAPQSPALQCAVTQLIEWFAGERHDFDLLLAPAETPRGQALRDAMIDISYGDTTSYGDLARKAGSVPRAMGQACARNPFPIVVPCHRVLNADGSIGHYSGGEGRRTKSWLLEHERRHAGKTLL